jgi:hypothetical protein
MDKFYYNEDSHLKQRFLNDFGQEETIVGCDGRPLLLSEGVYFEQNDPD